MLATLKLIAKHAVENEVLATNPVEGVEVLSDSRIKAKIAVSPKEAVKVMIDAAPSRFSGTTKTASTATKVSHWKNVGGGMVSGLSLAYTPMPLEPHPRGKEVKI